MVERRVRGILLTEFGDLIRAHRGVRWLRFIDEKVLAWAFRDLDPDAWYPLDAYDHLCAAAMRHIATECEDEVRQWGRDASERIFYVEHDLFSAGDPRETLMRLLVTRNSSFSFPVMQVTSIRDGSAAFFVDHGLSPISERTACNHLLGFIERALEISGASGIRIRIAQRSWDGSPASIMAVAWSDRRAVNGERDVFRAQASLTHPPR